MVTTPLLQHLAALHQSKKDYHQAIDTYQKLLQQKPENTDVLNDLAWTYMQLNDPRALPIAEAAYNKQPDSANIADTYGTILVLHNQLDKGITLLKQSIKQAPENKDSQFHLAKAYYLQGDKKKSLAILQQILKGDDSFSEKEAALALLQKQSRSQ